MQKHEPLNAYEVIYLNINSADRVLPITEKVSDTQKLSVNRSVVCVEPTNMQVQAISRAHGFFRTPTVVPEAFVVECLFSFISASDLDQSLESHVFDRV